MLRELDCKRRERRRLVAGIDPRSRERCRYKNSATPPPAPDPAATAKAQTQSNLATADANRVNTATPFGTSNWAQDPATGRWTQTSAFSDPVSKLYGGMYDVAQSLQPAAANYAHQAVDASGKPLDFSGANEDIIRGGPQPLMDSTADAYYNKQKSFLDPQWDTQQKNLQDQLSRQGIPVGSEAYNQAMTNLNNSKTQAYDAARSGAVTAGASGASNLFGLALQGQQQGVNQQQLARTAPLASLNQIYGGAA